MGCGPSIAGTNVQPALAECHYTLSHADSPRVLLSNDSAVGPTSSCCRAAACGSVTGSPIAPRPGGLSARSYEPVDPHGPSCPLAARGPPRCPHGKDPACRFPAIRVGPRPAWARTGRASHVASRPSAHQPRDSARTVSAYSRVRPRWLGSARPGATTISASRRTAHVRPLSYGWSPSPPRHWQRRTHSRLSPLLTPSTPDSFDGNRPVVHGTPLGSPWCSALGPEACCLPGCTSSPCSSPHAVHT